ncbi:16S rRNA (guanine(966)-N(2))-methyltransferase RsmD [Labrys wisconsinensis]|uniref:16S rRNA (Guanine966-N2)-methyltransferase n=1 Tax=Labrys wisconsinensis TaxID=425677 RepID=A0ABU0JP85_9HYPH|nr:16S rRNA (guanine(966)-N(2))-methyltransferase RsmD [Labrys wisconsinensis]MDQ0474962.1 16S rRNA (guanine966-N2)-methyltransferase [Labrys wisconsinensis]
MRIVAGQFRGKQLATPRSDAIRPTSDRLRETLFNILVHAYDDPVREARVIDLFAGTGALGLEALSRGARFAVFVDDGAEARGLIRANIDAMGLGGRTRLFRRDATRLGAIGPIEPFSLAFLDPPYRRDLAPKALESLAAGGWLAPGALCVVEEAAEVEISAAGFVPAESRDYGETRLTILCRAGGVGEG